MPTGVWCLSSNQPHAQRDHTTLGSVIICFCQEQLHAKSIRIQEGALAWAGGLRGQQQQQQRATAATVPHRRIDTDIDTISPAPSPPQSSPPPIARAARILVASSACPPSR